MTDLANIGLTGLAYLLENTRIHEKDFEKIAESVYETLSSFLGVDKYELMRKVEDVRTTMSSKGVLPIEYSEVIPKYLEQIDELAKRVDAILIASSLIAYNTGEQGIPIKLFKAEEAKVIIVLSLILSYLLSNFPDEYRIRFSRNEGLAIKNSQPQVASENPIVFEALVGKSGEYLKTYVVETLYTNRIISSPSRAFLHAVLGLISFSPGLKEAASIGSRLRSLSEEDILSFILALGFYVGLPRPMRNRTLIYDKTLRREIPITHDMLREAREAYLERFGFLPMILDRFFEVALERRLGHSEAKAISLAAVIGINRKMLSRIVDEEDVRLLMGDALGALFKIYSHIYSSRQAPNIPNTLVKEEGISRIAIDEDSPAYSFLRQEFENFEIKYMDDIVFELPFRLRLLRLAHQRRADEIIELNASKAISFIHSLGSPMHRRTNYKLLTFLGDALLAGRLASAEITYERGTTLIKYKRSRFIPPTDRVLKTSAPMVSDVLAFSRIIRSIADRNSRLLEEMTIERIERLSGRFFKEFSKLRKKYKSEELRELSRISPIVLITLPIALIASKHNESLTTIFEYIDFAEDPLKSRVNIARGDAERIFSDLKDALELKPYVIDDVYIHLFKVAAASGLTLQRREYVKEKRLRPLKLEEIIEVARLVRGTIEYPRAVATLYAIASNVGYVSLYGEADTVVTLAYYKGYSGLFNSREFVDVASVAYTRDVPPASGSFIERAKKGRTPVDPDTLRINFMSPFFRYIREGYKPLIAKRENILYVRLIEE